MKKIKIVTFLSLVLFLLIGCNKNQNTNDLEIEISNQSTEKIDALKIYPVNASAAIDSLVFDSIEEGSTSKKTWKNLKLSSDGTFLIIAKLSEKTLNHSFGYYTNGLLLYKSIYVKVYDDSIVVKTTQREF